MRIGKGFFRIVYFLPTVVPAAVAVIIWRFIYDPDGGVLNEVLAQFGVARQLWLQNASLVKPALVAVMTWAGFGTTSLIYLASLQDVPQELYEAAELDGATPLAAHPAHRPAPSVPGHVADAHPADHRRRAGLYRTVPADQRRSRSRDAHPGHAHLQPRLHPHGHGLRLRLERDDDPCAGRLLDHLSLGQPPADGKRISGAQTNGPRFFLQYRASHLQRAPVLRGGCNHPAAGGRGGAFPVLLRLHLWA